MCVQMRVWACTHIREFVHVRVHANAGARVCTTLTTLITLITLIILVTLITNNPVMIIVTNSGNSNNAS